MSKENSKKRFRNYTFLVYPDSAPTGWQEALSQMHIPCLISPLHDKDFNLDGSPKKPHYHVIVMYDGPTSIEQPLILCRLCNSPEYVQKVESIRGSVRYLTHKDDPEKAQYNDADVMCIALSRDDYNAYITLPSDRYKVIKEIQQFIIENNFIYYDKLLDYCLFNDREDWYRVLTDSSTYVIKEYMKSRAYRLNCENTK